MCKFKMGFRRFGASFAALLMVCCFSAPALAAGHVWPATPSYYDFVAHHGSWYVWQKYSIDSEPGFELTCFVMQERNETDTSTISFPAYSTNPITRPFTVNGLTTTLLSAIPYVPLGASGYWSELPSFPVGSRTSYSHCAYVRLYPCTGSGALSSIDDVFSDTTIHFYLTSAFASSGSSFADNSSDVILDDFPVYVPNTIFVAGSKTDSSSNHTSFTLEDGATNFWATPSNRKLVELSSSHTSSHSMRPFAQNAFIPSSELGFVFFKSPGSGYHPYASDYALSDLRFVATLWVPAALLPSDTQVGDWISKADVESLQDQLTKEFDVNSDTLKNSKDNLNSWNSTSSVDSDAASGATGLLNGIFQNLGTFLFSVSLLCFGAVVLRMLIRKAVDG